MPRLLTALTLLLAALLLPLPHEWSAGWRSELLNRMHVPLFALLGILLPARKAWITLLIAGAVELVQPWVGRSASWADFGWGVLGAVTALIWHAKSLPWRLIALVTAIAPPATWWVQIAKAQSEAQTQFPVLMNGPASLLWVLSPGAEHSEAGLTLRGNSSVRVEVSNRDWNAFQALELEATLDAARPLELGIRLDIGAGLPNRVQAGAKLQPGPIHLRVPWPDNARLSPVKQIVLFLGEVDPEARLRMKKVRLLPAAKN